MKVAILAGGLGTRLSEETAVKPKPMVEIGREPILWHIMKTYAAFGFSDFVVALGYKGEHIKDYFVNYAYHAASLTVRLGSGGGITVHQAPQDDWTVHLLDTGLSAMTGWRVKRVAEYVGRETLMLTYGDGVSNVDIRHLLAFHRAHGKLATVTAVRPPARFGAMELDGDAVARFEEKPQIGEGWVSGGFFVLEPGALDYPADENTVFEHELARLAARGELAAYRHEGFWQCIDTLRDVRYLEGLWQEGQAQWKVWS